MGNQEAYVHDLVISPRYIVLRGFLNQRDILCLGKNRVVC